MYLLDLAVGFPFGRADGVLIDILYLLSTATIGAFSFLTLRELR